jgi:anti-anti-sigma factor
MLMTWLCSPPDLPARRRRGPRTEPLAIEVHFNQGTATVLISGELDVMTMPSLAVRLSLILREQPRRLVLDMARTRFMDCGSARLIASTRELLPAGQRPVIRHPSPTVRRVLELTGLNANCEIEG